MIPADIVILGVADKSVSGQGICYVETKSLDGETNLKIRSALPNTFGKLTDLTDYTKVVGRLEAEHPNRLITSFNGILELRNYGKEPIRIQNMLLRGCVLRNTEWVIGLVVNTGHDTKIMMGNTETRPKTSFLENQASKEISRIIFLLMLFCFAGATGSAIWNNENDPGNVWYLKFDNDPVSYWFVKFFYFFCSMLVSYQCLYTYLCL
jgi:magnesium-transporting ATPase (P-type)